MFRFVIFGRRSKNLFDQVLFGLTFEEAARSKEHIFMEEEVMYKSADDFWLGEIPEISFSKMKTL